jgi:hypothetical protein
MVFGLLLAVLASIAVASAFVIQKGASVSCTGPMVRGMSTNIDVTNTLRVPVSFDEMIRATSSAMTDAYEQGVTRQMIRLLMPRDPASQDLGIMFEDDADFSTTDLLLYPTDESWQGGIMQLYRAAAPTCQAILRKFAKNEGGIPPRMVEDRSIDDSGVDGIGLWMSQNPSPADDVSCFVQPTQETIDSIERISAQAGKRLVCILNPQWRNVDDALDAASKEAGFLGSLATFLGGKGNALKRLDDLGYQNVFTVEGYGTLRRCWNCRTF